MNDCLWNSPSLLRQQAKILDREGFTEAAEGCRLRALKVERLLPIIQKKPHLAKLLEEPVDVKG